MDVEIGYKRLYNGFVTERRGFMKQRQRLTRLLPPLLLIFLLCLLCGCSVRQPDTRLTLNPDGSGERVINCVIANNGLSEKIDGGEAAFDAFPFIALRSLPMRRVRAGSTQTTASLSPLIIFRITGKRYPLYWAGRPSFTIPVPIICLPRGSPCGKASLLRN